MTRTPEDVFFHHGIRAAMAQLLDGLPNGSWDFKTQIYEGDVLLFEWAADSVLSHVDDGVNTVVFGDGLIRVQTARCTVQLKTQRDGQGHE